MIALRDVSKSFAGVRVLSHVSVSFAQGSAVCVMAPSGAGKTTLANVLLGLVKPDSGTVETGGARFSCAFQEERLAPQLSAAANVRLACGRGVQAQEALAAVGLSAQDAQKPAAQLSGRQQRRVSLVRALLAASDCVVLDEPFKGLDEEAKRRAVAFVRAQQGARTLLCITHDEADAALLGAEVFRLAARG